MRSGASVEHALSEADFQPEPHTAYRISGILPKPTNSGEKSPCPTIRSINRANGYVKVKYITGVRQKNTLARPGNANEVGCSIEEGRPRLDSKAVALLNYNECRLKIRYF